MNRRQRGAGSFEFALCAALAAVLAGVLLLRLLEVRVESERTAARQVAAAVRTALAVRAARAADGAELAMLAQENPMRWLARLPPNYLGEYYAPDLESLTKGSWFFDRTDKSINYLLSRDTFSHGTSNLLKFKVEFIGSPQTSRTGRIDGGSQGLLLQEVAVADPDNQTAVSTRPLVRTTSNTERIQ
jgi:general secretion pathway protein G